MGSQKWYGKNIKKKYRQCSLIIMNYLLVSGGGGGGFIPNTFNKYIPESTRSIFFKNLLWIDALSGFNLNEAFMFNINSIGNNLPLISIAFIRKNSLGLFSEVITFLFAIIFVPLIGATLIFLTRVHKKILREVQKV